MNPLPVRTGVLERPLPLEGVHPVKDWPWAQARTAFVLVGPRPDSPWQVTDASLRGESAKAYSTLRYSLSDGAGRRLRVKQYFNDWWIPTIADVSLRSAGRPIVVGESVAFTGRDYRRNAGCCGHRFGTAIECSLETGELADAEWSSLWSGFDAIVPEAPRQLRASSYARRHYWNRWQRTDAPWDTTEISSLTWSDPTTEAMERAAWALTADRWAPVPGTIDSIGFRSGGPHGDEVQMVFRWPLTLDTSAWLRVLRRPTDAWRPLIDASEVNRPRWTPHEVGGVATDSASMDPTCGNWMFAWRAGSAAYELHLRARKGLTAPAADAVVRNLVA